MTKQVKPQYRGLSHQYAFYISLLLAAVLIWLSSGAVQITANAVFAFSVSNLLGTSALYHRVTWSPIPRERMRRLDHAAIYVLISGTNTPIMLASLDFDTAIKTLAIVWGASLIGIYIEFGLPRAPKWLSALMYIAIGWVTVFVMDEIVETIGTASVVLIVLGGILYTIGGAIYARKKPNPWPLKFGYHEVFHALVIAGAALHYAVIIILTK